MSQASEADYRGRRYVPLSVEFACGGTGTKLKEKFGRDGVLIWACLLAACKRSREQGHFRYTSESNGWDNLGLLGCEPDFTLGAYFEYTGRLKKTRKTRCGDVVDVQITAWGEWNQTLKRDRDAARKASSRAESRESEKRTEGDTKEAKTRTELEFELEVNALEVKALQEHSETGADAPLAIDVKTVYEHWRNCRGRTSARYDKISDARRKKIVTRLAEFSVADLLLAIDQVANDDWPERADNDDLVQLFKSHESVDRFLEMTTPRKESQGGKIDFSAYDRGNA